MNKLLAPTLVLMQSEFAQKYVYKDRLTLNPAIGLINEDFSHAIDKLLLPNHIIWGEWLYFHLANAELNITQTRAMCQGKPPKFAVD